MPATQRTDLAPVVPWARFINAQVATKRHSKVSVNPKTKRVTVEGIHRLYVGRTRSGKTTLCRIMTRMDKACLVLGTKPNDPSLDDYVNKEGFLRIKQWPPTKKELRMRGPYEQVKLLLWPEMKAYGDLKRNRPHYRNALHDIQVEGAWSVVLDEGFQVCRKGGLDLGEEVSEIAYGGAGNGISQSIIIQRPAGVPVIVHEQSHELYQFKSGNLNDLRALASYAGTTPRIFADNLQTLKGHQFLHAPMVGGREWEISEVPRDWAT